MSRLKTKNFRGFWSPNTMTIHFGDWLLLFNSWKTTVVTLKAHSQQYGHLHIFKLTTIIIVNLRANLPDKTCDNCLNFKWLLPLCNQDPSQSASKWWLKLFEWLWYKSAAGFYWKSKSMVLSTVAWIGFFNGPMEILIFLFCILEVQTSRFAITNCYFIRSQAPLGIYVLCLSRLKIQIFTRLAWTRLSFSSPFSDSV